MNTDASVLPVNAPASAEDKTTAIVAYLTLIGFIVAIVLHGQKKTQLGAFHLRQMLGLIVTSIAAVIAGMVLAFIPILGWLADLAIWIGLLVFWVMGLLAALKGEIKGIPVLGKHYEKWFATAFN